MRPGLVPGHTVDRVDVAAGMEFAAKLGYNGPTAQMIVEYALMRHARGEEAGAQRTWLSYFPRDLTSWTAILARAITAADIKAHTEETPA